jgi:hypothetical protein
MMALSRCRTIGAKDVGGHLGVRISNFAPKKPSNGVSLNLCGVWLTDAHRSASTRCNAREPSNDVLSFTLTLSEAATSEQVGENGSKYRTERSGLNAWLSFASRPMSPRHSSF